MGRRRFATLFPGTQFIGPRGRSQAFPPLIPKWQRMEVSCWRIRSIHGETGVETDGQASRIQSRTRDQRIKRNDPIDFAAMAFGPPDQIAISGSCFVPLLTQNGTSERPRDARRIYRAMRRAISLLARIDSLDFRRSRMTQHEGVSRA